VRFPPPWPEGTTDSEPARIGDGPEIRRSSEELDDAYDVGLALAVRVWLGDM
jgi:hypothetical protein